MEKIEYYLMRHAADYGRIGPFVNYRGMLGLKNMMDKFGSEFEKKFPNKELFIIHSELPRAFHTALLIREMIGGGITIHLKGDPCLNSDRLLLNEEYVKNTIAANGGNEKVCLIISHQPDIKCFCREEFENSEYMLRSVEIEDRPSESDATDDLPF